MITYRQSSITIDLVSRSCIFLSMLLSMTPMTSVIFAQLVSQDTHRTHWIFLMLSFWIPPCLKGGRSILSFEISLEFVDSLPNLSFYILSMFSYVYGVYKVCVRRRLFVKWTCVVTSTSIIDCQPTLNAVELKVIWIEIVAKDYII